MTIYPGLPIQPNYQYPYPSWWYTTTTQASGKPVEVAVGTEKVTDLDEDGTMWLVETPETTSPKSIRYAVLGFIQENYTEGSDEYFDAVESLAVASLEYSSGWFATGHAEGEFVTDVDAPKQLSGWIVK